jgi:transcriptional regulator with PAS, ATPase and Fis domain
VVITQCDTIVPDLFALDKIAKSAENGYDGRSLKEAVNIFKKHYIRQTLDMNRWNQTKTAKLLGIQRTYLSRLIKELNINR